MTPGMGMRVFSGRFRLLCVLLLGMSGAVTARAAEAPATGTPVTETIVFVRHGEKPPLGLGQLTCQGFNRALALPAVIRKMFGRPDAVMAPNPAVQKEDSEKLYDYVRPLATIEPTAIAFGLPIQADLGFADIAGLQKALEAPNYRGSLVVVAWEHYFIVQVVRALLAAHGGNPASVPDWKSSDFDSIYVVRVMGDRAAFETRQQGLDGQPQSCP